MPSGPPPGPRPSADPRGAETAGGATPLRIAFFTDSFVPTHDGVAQVTDTLARALVRLGHEVTVHTVRPPGAPSREARPDGVRIRRHASFAAPRYPQYRIAPLPWVAPASLRRRFEVAHIHTPGLVGLAGLLAARKARVPTVGTYHTNLTDMLRGAGRTRVSRAFFRAWGAFSLDLCQGCDLATAPTEAAAAALRRPGRTAGRSAPRVVVNGVDTGVFRPGRLIPRWSERLGSKDAPLITFLGRLTRDKGAARFLDAIERLRTDRPWFAVVAGEGPLGSSVEGRLAPGRPLASRARYVGAVTEEEKPSLLSQSRVFVLPSLSDTSSVALLEAMASGAACVVTRWGGPAELAARSQAALVVDPQDPGDLGDAIERLLEDDDLVASFRERGRTWVEQHASAATMARQFVEAYQSVRRPRVDRERDPSPEQRP